MSDTQEVKESEIDELLAGFGEAQDEEAAAAAQPAPVADPDLTDLDAFLNEFNAGTAAADDNASHELDEFDAGPAVAVHELDPDLAGADDAVEGEEAVPELAAGMDALLGDAEAEHGHAAAAVADLGLGPEERTPGPAEFDLPIDLDEPAARSGAYAAAGGVVADMFDFEPEPPSRPALTFPAQEAVSIMAPDDEPAPVKRLLDVSTLGVALFALVVAAVAGWFAVGLHGQLDQLREELTQQHQAPAASAGPDEQTQGELARLNQRVNEVAMILNGPMSHLSDANKQQLDAITNRLNQLDREIGELQAQLASPPKGGGAAVRSDAAKATAKAAPKPAPAKPATVKPAAKPMAAAPAPAGGDWVVNVASLSDAKAAAAEQARLKQAGINAEIEQTQMSGHTWYRVRVGGFNSRQEAQVYSDMLKEKINAAPWVAPR